MTTPTPPVPEGHVRVRGMAAVNADCFVEMFGASGNTDAINRRTVSEWGSNCTEGLHHFVPFVVDLPLPVAPPTVTARVVEGE